MIKSGVAAVPQFMSMCVAAVLLTVLLLPESALANQCGYSDGNNDNGPCVEVRNELKGSGRRSMNLWCHNGPTPRSKKIILKDWGHIDSFTCRGVAGSTTITIQRTQIGCNTCELTIFCAGKVTLKLFIPSGKKEERLKRSGCSLP